MRNNWTQAWFLLLVNQLPYLHQLTCRNDLSFKPQRFFCSSDNCYIRKPDRHCWYNISIVHETSSHSKTGENECDKTFWNTTQEILIKMQVNLMFGKYFCKCWKSFTNSTTGITFFLAENFCVRRKCQFEWIFSAIPECLRGKCSTIGSGFDNINSKNEKSRYHLAREFNRFYFTWSWTKNLMFVYCFLVGDYSSPRTAGFWTHNRARCIISIE